MRIYLSILLLVITLFTSCEFQENIKINDDGSGDYSYAFTIDAGAFSGLSDSLSAEDKKLDEVVLTKDSLLHGKDFAKYAEENFSKNELKKHKKQIDEFAKLVENYDIRTQEYSNNKAIISLTTAFSSINSLQDGNKIFMKLLELDRIQKGKTRDKAKTEDFNSFVNSFTSNYSSSQNSFLRKIIKNEAIAKKIESGMKAKDEEEENLMNSVGSMIKYKAVYNFPKRISSSSNKSAVYSLDGKTMTVEYGFFEILKNPDLLSFEVTF